MRLDCERPVLDVLEALLADEHGLVGFELLRLHRTHAAAVKRLGDVDTQRRGHTACRALRALAFAAGSEGMFKAALAAWKELETLRSDER